MGLGKGGGEGQGEGHGGDQTAGILAGSVVACCFLVFMWVIGIPLLIAGIVMVNMSKSFDDNSFGSDSYSTIHKAGIGCIVVAVIFMIIGIVLIVLTCCLGSKPNNRSGGQIIQGGTTNTVIATNTIAQPQPSYPPQPYAGQPQPYPGQPQYYPVQQPQQYAGQAQPPYNPNCAPQQQQYDPNAPPPYMPPPSGLPPKH